MKSYAFCLDRKAYVHHVIIQGNEIIFGDTKEKALAYLRSHNLTVFHYHVVPNSDEILLFV